MFTGMVGNVRTPGLLSDAARVVLLQRSLSEEKVLHDEASLWPACTVLHVDEVHPEMGLSPTGVSDWV